VSINSGFFIPSVSHNPDPIGTVAFAAALPTKSPQNPGFDEQQESHNYQRDSDHAQEITLGARLPPNVASNSTVEYGTKDLLKAA